MAAVQFNPAKLELSLVKKPPPRAPVADEVVVQVAYAGICGTDLHIAEVNHLLLSVDIPTTWNIITPKSKLEMFLGLIYF